jgi:tetratricopeptide (TPR) repeat protein
VIRRARPNAIALAILLLTLTPSSARAGDKEDSATIAAVDKIVRGDVAQSNFGDAKKKLHTLLVRCKRGCSPSAVAQVHMAIGLVAAQIGRADDAKTSWFEALNSDANVQLPANGVSPAVRTQFEQTQKAWLAANPQPDDSQKAGWANKQAYELSKQGVAAEVAGNYPECIEKDKAALVQEENLRARLHLALCEAKAGKILDALRDNSKALEAARAKNDSATLKQVQERVTELIPRLSHVTFQLPAGVSDLRIVFDDRPIPPERMADNFTIDPGAHKLHAEGVLRGARVSYDDDKIEVGEGQTVSLRITLKPAALTGGQLECMVAAKTQEEIQQCLPSERKPLVVHLGLDMSGYLDTTAVRVLTPAIRGSVVSPTAGWNVGASYLVDMLTAASPDVVATASRRFADTRHAATLTGGYQPGRFGAQLFGSYSSESDYISRTVGATVNGEFMDKQLTPQLGFSHTWDTIGRAGTSYDVFSRPFSAEEISAGATIILSPVSLLVLGATAALESGDQSKTYRFIPLFEPGVSVPVGASPNAVNLARLPAKALEQLPLDRQRFSVGARFIQRVRSTSTLRIEERVYNDTWGLKASSTDARYFMDLSQRFRVWPHGRVHVQSGTTFYKRIYGATLNSDGSATIPEFRTSDRELSPMFGITVGGGTRFALTSPGSKVQLAVVASADALFNYYLNALYLRTRLAGYGTLGLEADFE